jgi:alpha-beta hydrolase superfamily lysophospholipase
MGATTALLYLLHYQANFVKAIVLDSPFHDLEVLSQRMAAKKLKVPKLIAKGMIKFIKSKSWTLLSTFSQG